MSDYNWCHNPDCHTYQTQSRVRGTGDNKVLRTVKIKVGRYNYGRATTPQLWDYFCNQHCLFNFLNKNVQEIVGIAPVTKPSETPIKVKKIKYENYRYRYDSVNGQERVPYISTRTSITLKNSQE